MNDSIDKLPELDLADPEANRAIKIRPDEYFREYEAT